MSLNFSGRLQGKRVLVTGTGKGVGRALTIRLDKEGAIVYAVTRTQADLDSLAKETSRIIPVCVDVGDWHAVRASLETVLKEPLDILVNNAAVAPMKPILELTKEGLDNQVEINFKAVVNFTQLCAQNMVAHGKGGCIVNVSSVAAVMAYPEASVYSAMKAAVDAFTRNVSAELGKHKIRALSLTLGCVDTSMLRSVVGPDQMDAFAEGLKDRFHLGEVLIPMEEVVDSILFMASGVAHMMTGCRFVLDGGMSNS